MGRGGIVGNFVLYICMRCKERVLALEEYEKSGDDENRGSKGKGDTRDDIHLIMIVNDN